MFYRPGLDQHGLAHNPFKALVSPRPIAWVSTIDADGRANLAPFSFFNAVAEAPPILMIAPYGAPPEKSEGPDTLRNILETKEFVIHATPYALRDQMNVTAAQYPHGVDEFEAAGLTKAGSEIVKPPRIAEAPIAFECAFLTRTELPSERETMKNGAVFGQVVGIHIDDAVIVDGKVDVTRFRPLARLGYMDYASVDAVFDMPRPTKPDAAKP
ncbi:MAG: flavin reductase family protein [Pseudomonadota bacterium]